MNQTTKPLIAFLDAATVDRGDVCLDSLNNVGDLILYNRTTSDQLLGRLENVSVVITNKTPLPEKILHQLPELKLICVAATGVNHIDLQVAQHLHIAVTNVAGYSTTTVAEHTLLFLLSLSHRLLEHHRAVIQKEWSASPDFALLSYNFSDLRGKTLGIIGYGNIGQEVARLAKAFGMEIKIATLPFQTYKAESKIRREPLEAVLTESDFLTLHCALSEKTHHFINPETLKKMKPSACLINLARGALIDENALFLALQKQQLAGYATDVFNQEPPPADHPLLHPSLQSKVIFTPHIAWASRNSRQRLIEEMALNIRSFQWGQKRNRLA